MGSLPVPSDASAAGDENAELDSPFSPTQQEKEATKVAETTPRKPCSRWVDPDRREWVRLARSSSTPRKRVISDEHWKKKKKPPPRYGNQQPIEDMKQEKRPSEVSRYVSSATEKRERRQGRKQARPRAENGTFRDRMAELEAETTLPPSRGSSVKDEAVLLSDLESGVDDDLPRKLEVRVPPKQSVQEPRRSLGVSAPTKDEPVRQRHRTETLDKSPTTLQGPFEPGSGSTRSRKGGLISQAKERLTRNESVPPSSNRLPSIEAWLDEQPDPFVDSNPEPVEIPAPLKTRPKKQKVEVAPENIEDPNKIWNYIESEDHKPEHVSSSRRRRRRRTRRSQEATDSGTPEITESSNMTAKGLSNSPTPQDKTNVPKEESPSGLKRRGARALRARTGSAPIKEISPTYKIEPTVDAQIPPAKAEVEVPLLAEEQPKPLRSCPPTGPHRLSTIASVETFESQAEGVDESDKLAGDIKGLQRRLTTHEDLMSVLSLPRVGGSIKSARSIRTARSRISTATLGEVFEELEADESKYMRELKTLVDGVIPVLLQCVLSKSDSAAAAGLFSSSSSARDDLNFTKPIFDMGVALERLKTLHKRIPNRDLNSLLSWAQSAHKVYLEYLRAWRLGFQDVIVNLAPPEGHTETEVDEGMARDENGDVINSNGEKVDVAYLLKRPLVRIKNLSKVFARLKILKPSSKSALVASDYDDLIKTARRRSNDEKSRLEDEAAANIDPTKARDLRTLAVLSGVRVDKSRKVKARDCFSLTVHHSSGQRIDCQIELFLRQNQPGLTAGGDLLICEVENRGKWLLFPPFETSSVSTRYGDIGGEIIVMVRGLTSSVRSWHELLVLKTDDIETASEWVNMLGTHPMPPKLNRSSSFMKAAGITSLLQDSGISKERASLVPRAPAPAEIDIPIGEPSVIGSEDHERPRTAPDVHDYQKPTPYPASIVSSERSLPQLPHDKDAKALPTPPQSSVDYGDTAHGHTTSDSSSPALRRARGATKKPVPRDGIAPSSRPSTGSTILSGESKPSDGHRKISRTDRASREWMSSPEVQRARSDERDEDHPSGLREDSPDRSHQRPLYHRAISSTPSKELPTIPRLRGGTPPSTPLTESIRDQWSALSSGAKKLKHEKKPTRGEPIEDHAGPQRSHPAIPFTDDLPMPPPHRSRSPSPSPVEDGEATPLPPPHRLSEYPERAKPIPALGPQTPLSPRLNRRDERRSSSPLKHEYAPSTESDSSESDDESVASSTSNTSEDATLETRDVPTPLLSLRTPDMRRTSNVPPPASLPDLPAATVAPSSSASQAPYRTVPHVSHLTNAPTSRTIATLYSWSDKGMWESLYENECSIVVSPGLIEAFEMSAAHSHSRAANEDGTVFDGSSGKDSNGLGSEPLVAFELNPLVPLRRGTALDISIRPESCKESKDKTSANIMFRSRNAEECEALYAMINQARINNPTWVAQSARPRPMPHGTFNTGPGSARHSRWGWLGFGSRGRRSSYRASSAPMSGPPSLDGVSETSVGSMHSALSALRRFSVAGSRGRGMFNLNRSSVIRRNGRFGTSGATSLYSSSTGTTRTGGSGSGANSPVPSQVALGPVGTDHPTPPAAAIPKGTVNNMKIRLYVRESAAKWRDMGAGRLSVMPAPVILNGIVDGTTTPVDNDLSPPGTAGGSRPPSTSVVGQPGQSREPRLPSSNHTPHRVHGNGNEKRILIVGKTKGETLLDVTLHESCFERIARTGIAVSVWEEHEEVSKEGGVVGGKGTTYMVQMKGEAEAAWVFSMVGRLRY